MLKMKKLLILVVCCFLSAPSFGVDWIKDRIYVSFGRLGVNYDIGYYYCDVGCHYTDSIKISVGSVVNPSSYGKFFCSFF